MFKPQPNRHLYKLLLMLVVFSIAPVAAQSPAGILESGDLERFISSYPALVKDFQAAGRQFNGLVDPSSVDNLVQDLKADTEAEVILQKHGWTSAFYEKLATILLGYIVLLFEREAGAYQSEITETYRLIADAPDLAAEAKATLQAQMAATLQEVQTLEAFFTAAVHPADVAVIRDHFEKLELIFDQL